MEALFFLGLDAASVVISAVQSNAPQDGMTQVSADLYAQAAPRVGLCRYVGGVVVPLPSPPIDLPGYASAAFAARRDGGVTVSGMLIKTDESSRNLIAGAYALSEVRPDSPIDFKAAGGWITISASTMQTVAVAVGSWVQLCYSAYRRVSEGIASGAITTPAQIDAAFAAVALPG